MNSEIVDKLRKSFYELKMYFASKLLQKLFLIFVLFLIVLPPILGLIYIKMFGVNLLYWDQWEFIQLIDKLYNNTLTFGDFFAQHNEHRIFFPRIIMLILAVITHYNTIIEMYFSWILTIIILSLIYIMYRTDFGESKSTIIKFIPVIWLMFSFRQFENIIWGWQIQIYLSVLGFVSSIYMLEKAEKVNPNFLMAIFCGIISTFSFINGLLVWPVGLMYITLLKIKCKRTLSIAWAITGVLVWVIFFYNWVKPSHHPSVFFALENIGRGIEYLVMNIGAPLSFEISNALGIGAILVILIIICMIFVVKNEIINENAKWIAFILFSLTSSLSLTIGRSGFGVEQGLSSRYVTITLLGVVGLYLIIVKLYNGNGANNKEKYAILYGMIISIILAGIVSGYAGGIIAGETIKNTRENMVNDLFNYEFTDDQKLEKLYPNADIVRDSAKILEKYQLNVFYSSIPEWNTLKMLKGGIMSIDSIGIGKRLNSTESDAIIRKDNDPFFHVVGWAVDDISRDGTVKTFLVFKSENEELFFPTIKMLRQDVADFFHINSFRQSGWSATIRSNKFQNQCYSVSLRILRANGQEYYEIDGNFQHHQGLQRDQNPSLILIQIVLLR